MKCWASTMRGSPSINPWKSCPVVNPASGSVRTASIGTV